MVKQHKIKKTSKTDSELMSSSHQPLQGELPMAKINNNILTKIQKLQSEMGDCLAEREEQIEALLAALIAGEHLLLLGPPGTAKSLLANMLCNQIDDANYFQWLMTKYTMPEELYGPVSMQGLKKDKYKRITTGKMPEAHIAVMDEIWKAGSTILNTTLTLVNERKFHNDGVPTDVPLLMLIGASNELPQGEELGALYDRFLMRFWVEYIGNDDLFIDLIRPNSQLGNNTPSTKITLDEIAELQDLVCTIQVSDEMLAHIRSICIDLRNEGIVASDRRWKKAVHALRAFALLRGKNQVTEDELEMLSHMMWDQPEDKRKIDVVVAKYGNPLNLEALRLQDQAKEAFDKWFKAKGTEANKDDSISLDTNGILKAILKEVNDKLASADPAKTDKLVTAKIFIADMKRTVVTELDI